MSEFFGTLKENNYIHTLILSSTLSYFSVSTRILDLENNIGPEGAGFLAKMIYGNLSLYSIKLESKEGFSDFCLFILFHIISLCCNIGDEGIKTLTEALKKSKCVLEVVVNDV